MTWNEWHEGTQIEPGQEIVRDDSAPFALASASYGFKYIDLLANALGYRACAELVVRGMNNPYLL